VKKIVAGPWKKKWGGKSASRKEKKRGLEKRRRENASEIKHSGSSSIGQWTPEKGKKVFQEANLTIGQGTRIKKPLTSSPIAKGEEFRGSYEGSPSCKNNFERKRRVYEGCKKRGTARQGEFPLGRGDLTPENVVQRLERKVTKNEKKGGWKMGHLGKKGRNSNLSSSKGGTCWER